MIREIEQKDIPCCAQLIRDSFLTVAGDLNLTAQNAPLFTAFSISEEKLHDQLAREDHLSAVCCEENGRIVGYYALRRLGDHACELNHLCVHPDARRRRLGALLLRDAFDRAKQAGCAVVRIGIVEENKTLRRWYEAHGFAHTGTQKFDFFPFTVGYMEKRLSSHTTT